MPHGWPGNDRSLPKPSLVSVECDPPWPKEHRRRPSCDARHPRSIQVGSQQAEACGMGNRNRTTDWRSDDLCPSEWARPVAPRMGFATGCLSPTTSTLGIGGRPLTCTRDRQKQVNGKVPRQGAVDVPVHRPACCFPRGGTVQVHPRLSPSQIQMTAVPSP
jgi:hypothetical protein